MSVFLATLISHKMNYEKLQRNKNEGHCRRQRYEEPGRLASEGDYLAAASGPCVRFDPPRSLGLGPP